MIDKLYLKSYNNVFKQYFNETEKELTLKKVNIFVGANNSGKSRLMREIFLSFRSREVKEPFANNDINFPFIESKTVLSEYNKFEESYLKLVLDKGSIGKEKLHLKKIKDLLKPDLQSAYFSFNKNKNNSRTII